MSLDRFQRSTSRTLTKPRVRCTNCTSKPFSFCLLSPTTRVRYSHCIDVSSASSAVASIPCCFHLEKTLGSEKSARATNTTLQTSVLPSPCMTVAEIRSYRPRTAAGNWGVCTFTVIEGSKGSSSRTSNSKENNINRRVC